MPNSCLRRTTHLARSRSKRKLNGGTFARELIENIWESWSEWTMRPWTNWRLSRTSIWWILKGPSSSTRRTRGPGRVPTLEHPGNQEHLRHHGHRMLPWGTWASSAITNVAAQVEVRQVEAGRIETDFSLPRLSHLTRMTPHNGQSPTQKRVG